jgi:arylsulfatase A-like enzyme
MKLPFLRRLSLFLASAALGSAAPAAKPNIVIILADDLGYGDVASNHPASKIPTPHLDRLAAQGLRFTDAHSSSGVCSPTRYTLLTGRYHWRTGRSGIVPPFGPPMIAADRLTLPRLLQQHGYRTAAIGKWHLGWNWPMTPAEAKTYSTKPADPADAALLARALAIFAQPIPDGPTTRGFDFYFGPDVPNWPPYAFIENDRVLGVPSVFLPAALVGNNQASLHGPAVPDWPLDAILPTLADRTDAFLTEAARRPEPFFLYLPLTTPHTPLAVAAEWRGRSGLNLYADLVMQTDAVVGRVLATLERTGAAKNTLVIFTSDNGCAAYIGIKELTAAGHFPSGPFRGYKTDAWEGGHRVPFFVRWPGVVAPGGITPHLTHQADVMATIAEMLSAPLPATAAEDSFSLLPVLRGQPGSSRPHAVNQSNHGTLALRRGDWKLIFGHGSDGPRKDTDPSPARLYDLAADPGETKNLVNTQPALAAELTALMQRLIAEGRSTPGAPQKNDGSIALPALSSSGRSRGPGRDF